MSRPQYFLLVVLLGMLTALPPYSIDTSLAAMPDMADGLGTTGAAIQFTLGAYILGSTLGQAVVGPISDRYGRCPVLYVGLAVYIVTAVGCAAATSAEMLTAFRFVQGACVATARILPRAMARDLYDREDAARLLSYMTVIGGTAPIIAPLVGGYFTVWFGWRSVFVFMAAYAAAAFMATLPLLRETLPPARRTPLNPARLAQVAWIILCDRVFRAYAACLMFVAGGLYAFLTGSAPTLIRFLGETPQQFGFDFATVMLAYIGFSFLGGRLVGRFGIGNLLRAGVIMAAVGGVVMAGLAWSGFAAVWAIVAPMFVFMAAFAFILPQATAGAMSPFPDNAGMASSLLGVLQAGAGAVASGALGLLDDGTQLPMTTAIAAMGVGAALSYFLWVRRLPSR